MALQEQLNADLKEAMKSRSKERMTTLRMLKAAIKNTEIAQGKPIDDAGVTEVLSREVKRHRESITEFKKANRQDAVDKEEAELAIILEYLPQQMSREEIESIVRKVMEEVEARSPKDKGKLMSKLMPQLKGKAEGQLVNEVVTQLLESA